MTWLSSDQKLVFSDNLGQNISNKIKNCSKTEKVKKQLISTFACFSTTIAKVYSLEGRLGTRVCLHLNLRFS